LPLIEAQGLLAYDAQFTVAEQLQPVTSKQHSNGMQAPVLSNKCQ
jgi:hypothetical protein